MRLGCKSTRRFKFSTLKKNTPPIFLKVSWALRYILRKLLTIQGGTKEKNKKYFNLNILQDSKGMGYN